MNPGSMSVTDPLLVKRQKNKSKKYSVSFSEILDPQLVLVVADGRGAKFGRGGGGRSI